MFSYFSTAYGQSTLDHRPPLAPPEGGECRRTGYYCEFCGDSPFSLTNGKDLIHGCFEMIIISVF
jgi:hypothetical protein